MWPLETLLMGVLTALLLISPATYARELPEVESIGQRISDSVMSPFCPGRTLSACPSEDARKLRTEIITWLATGESESTVRKRLKERYGEDVTGMPTNEGFGLIAWAMPAIFLGIGGAMIFRTIRAKRP